jgi:hypothetical protein
VGLFRHEKQWVVSWQRHTIIVMNWWARTGESLIIDGRPVPQGKPSGILSNDLHGEIEVSGRAHEVRVHIGHTTGLRIGCHVFIDDELVGGDVGKRFLF